MLYIQIGSAWSCLPANNLNSWNENSHKCATAHASIRSLAVNACTEHIIELYFKRFWMSAFRVNLNDESSLFVSPIFELFSRKYVQLHHLLSCWTARLNWYTIWMRKYFFFPNICFNEFPLWNIQNRRFVVVISLNLKN